MTEERLRNLLVGGLAGDTAAYRAFLAALAAHVRSFLRRRLAGMPHEVEDLVQEILLAVHNQRHTYDPAQPLTAWAQAIARYKFFDLLRRRTRTDLRNEPLDDEGTLFAASDHEAVDARFDVAKLLRQLPERQRLPIQYVKIEGQSVSDAARRIGMSESAVKVSIHRGLKALAAKIRSAG